MRTPHPLVAAVKAYRLTMASTMVLGLCLANVAFKLLPDDEPDAAPAQPVPTPALALQPIAPLPPVAPPRPIPAVPLSVVAAPPTAVRIPAAAPAPTGRTWRVPRHIVQGILAVETRSVLRRDDSIKYVDKRRGAAGERGPTQIRKIAFRQVAAPGEQFWRLEVDPGFAIEVTERYLLWLRKQSGSWRRAVQAYNAGLDNPSAGEPYRRAVERASGHAIACMNGPMRWGR